MPAGALVTRLAMRDASNDHPMAEGPRPHQTTGARPAGAAAHTQQGFIEQGGGLWPAMARFPPGGGRRRLLRWPRGSRPVLQYCQAHVLRS